MPWWDDKLPAELGGVRFHVDSSSKRGGRRSTAHEFPGVDEAYVEDTGAAPHRHSVNAFLVGPASRGVSREFSWYIADLGPTGYHGGMNLSDLDPRDQAAHARAHEWVRDAVRTAVGDRIQVRFSAPSFRDVVGAIEYKVDITVTAPGQPDDLLLDGVHRLKTTPWERPEGIDVLQFVARKEHVGPAVVLRGTYWVKCW